MSDINTTISVQDNFRSTLESFRNEIISGKSAFENLQNTISSGLNSTPIANIANQVRLLSYDISNSMGAVSTAVASAASNSDKSTQQATNNMSKAYGDLGTKINQALIGMVGKAAAESQVYINKIAEQYRELGRTIQETLQQAAPTGGSGTNGLGKGMFDAARQDMKTFEQEYKQMIDELIRYKQRLNEGSSGSGGNGGSGGFGNGGSGSVGSSPNSNYGMQDFLTNTIGLKMMKGLTILGAVSLGVSAIKKTFNAANEISNMTLSAINTLSGNMLTPQGLQEAFQNASDFETIRTNIGFLSKNVNGANADKIYQDATILAKSTMFTEKDVTSNAEWMLKMGVNPNSDVMTHLVDLAARKPELGAAHAGFAIYDAANGRVGSLKMNYGISNEMLEEYYKSLSGSEKNRYKGAINNRGVAGDPEKYVNLIISYMDKNGWSGLAKEQSGTANGLLSTIKGQLEMISSDLIGYDSTLGKVIDGSFFKILKDALGGFDENGNATGFVKFLNDLSTNSAFIELQQQLGSLLQTIIDAFSNEDMVKFVEDILNAFTDVGKEAQEFIKQLSDSGQLKEILNNLPELVKASLEYELAKKEFLVSCAPLIPTAIDFLNALTSFIKDIVDYNIRSDMNTKAVEKAETTTDENGNEVKMAQVEYNDRILENFIGRSNLAVQDKVNLKEWINNDNKDTYNIEVKLNENGKPDFDYIAKLLMEEYEKAQANQ